MNKHFQHSFPVTLSIHLNDLNCDLLQKCLILICCLLLAAFIPTFQSSFVKLGKGPKNKVIHGIYYQMLFGIKLEVLKSVESVIDSRFGNVS